MYLMTQKSEQKRKRNKDKEVFKVVSRETIAIAVSLAINDGMQQRSTVGSTQARIHIMTAIRTRRFNEKGYLI